MTIEWNDCYKIGHAEIDAQHQELFDRINKFLTATDKSALMLGAMSLFQYTREHFTHEETLMRTLHYPSIAAHVKQHNDLLSRLNMVAQSIAKENLVRADLEAFLADWLFNHLATSDTKLAAYVKLQA